MSGTEGNIKKDEKSRQSLKILLLQKQVESQVMILIKYNGKIYSKFFQGRGDEKFTEEARPQFDRNFQGKIK